MLRIISALVFLAASAALPLSANAAASSKTCPVSGEALGSNGPIVNATYKGRTIPLCCKSCLKKFNANPQKYLK